MAMMSISTRSLAKRIARQFPPLRRLMNERDDLLRIKRWGPATYSSDHLLVWEKSVDFLQDPRFRRAYSAGMATGHRQSSSEDLHIEWRIHVCLWAAWHASRLNGDFVECGVNAGVTSVAICDYLDFNKTGKKFYLYDTFNGIPPEQIGPGEEAVATQNALYFDIYENAKRNFAPWPNAVLVRGRIPETLSAVPERVAYLHIDMNVVEPERAALAHFWPRIVPGGVVVFDDYGWMGYRLQKEAHDAFAETHGVKILTMPTGQGLLLKPHHSSDSAVQ